MDQAGDVGVACDDQAVRRNRGGLGEGPVNIEVELGLSDTNLAEGSEDAGAGIVSDDGRTITGDGPGVGVAELGVGVDVRGVRESGDGGAGGGEEEETG